MSLTHFHPLVQQWFTTELGVPDRGAAARLGRRSRTGRHTLIAAPTGSGKTLAAFLTAIDELFTEGLDAPLPDEVRVLYVSPLKALSADIHKNLAEPRRGIRQLAEDGRARSAPRDHRGGAHRRHDAGGARGDAADAAAHPGHDAGVALSAADLGAQPHDAAHRPHRHRRRDPCGDRHPARRAPGAVARAAAAAVPGGRCCGSACRRRRSRSRRSARFLVGSRRRRAPCTIVDEGHRARDGSRRSRFRGSTLDAVMSHEVWEEYYDRLAALIAAHRTTLVFVNTRRMAERLARHLSERLGEDAVTAHHGSLSKEKRLDAETRLKTGQLRALVATASLELGIDIGHVDLVCQIGSPHRIATLLQRVGRSGHTVARHAEGPAVPGVARRPGRVRGAAARGPPRRARRHRPARRAARRAGAADRRRVRRARELRRGRALRAGRAAPGRIAI